MTSIVFAGFYFGYIGSGSRFAQGVVYQSDEFTFPINYVEPDDDSDRVFILEQKGKVIVFDKDNVKNKKVAIDLDPIREFHFDWEGGLLGMEFSPQFATDNLLYLFYTVNDTSRHPDTNDCQPCINLTISRFTIDNNDRNKINASSELILLKIPQSRTNHRGGQLSFGPDGMFYVNIGDGTMGTAGSLTDFLGKILRIDVRSGSGGLNYTIPPDNPFVGNLEGYKEEIYAYGLRNPWRSSFDEVTGTLWTGDVGNFTWEEVDIIESGKNYGWPSKEGEECVYHKVTCPGDFTEPVIAYPHEPEESSTFFERIFGLSDDLKHPSGTAVIGGYVYRGSNFQELVGKYVFSDYTGGVWAIDYNYVSKTVESLEFLTRFPDTISSIGQGLDGELYFTGHILGYIYELKYLTNFLVTISVILLVMISVSLIVGTLWVRIRFIRKNETFDYKAELKPILNRTMFVFIIIIGLIGLSYMLQLLFYSIEQREN